MENKNHFLAILKKENNNNNNNNIIIIITIICTIILEIFLKPQFTERNFKRNFNLIFSFFLKEKCYLS